MNGIKTENDSVQYFMTIARIAGKDYLTKVLATSMAGAEHVVLDLGYVGKYNRAVQACQAFDVKGAKTDFFVYKALDAEPISYQGLKNVIMARNEEIQAGERAIARIGEIEQAIDMLNAELEHARQVAKGAN